MSCTHCVAVVQCELLTTHFIKVVGSGSRGKVSLIVKMVTTLRERRSMLAYFSLFDSAGALASGAMSGLVVMVAASHKRNDTSHAQINDLFQSSEERFWLTSEKATPLKAVQKLLIKTVGERDYHLFLQLRMFKASRDLLVSGYANYIDAYAAFLQSGHIPPCLEDDMYRLLQHSQSNEDDHDDNSEICIPFVICSFLHVYLYL